MKKALISCGVTVQLIVFVFFAYAKSSFSRDAASLVLKVFLQIFSPPHTVNGEKMDIK